MGGDYTSWRRAFKPYCRNSTRPQVEVKHCRAWFREWRLFAGLFAKYVAVIDVTIVKMRSMRGFGGRSSRRSSPRPSSGARSRSGTRLVRAGADPRSGVDLLKGNHIWLPPPRSGDRARRRHAAGHRRNAGDLSGHGRRADLPALSTRTGAHRGVDHELDGTALDPVDHVRGALADLVDGLGWDSHLADGLGRTAGGDDP